MEKFETKTRGDNMNAKEQWEARIEEDKRNEIIFSMLIDDYDEEWIEDDELNNLVGNSAATIETVKCNGFNLWVEKNQDRIEKRLTEWISRMNDYFK